MIEQEAPTTEWYNCFRELWGPDYLVDDALSHPAKFSKRLVERILDHIKNEEWVKKGDIVLDPFGGVGIGGIMCARLGYKWLGIEIEEHFHTLANDNFRLWKSRLALTNYPMPEIIQGDSQCLIQLLKGKVGLIFTAPPSGPLIKDTGGNEGSGGHGQKGARGRYPGGKSSGSTSVAGYGDHPGQMANMPFGTVAAVLSSPPYEDVGLSQNKPGTAEEQTERLQNLGYTEAQIKHLLSNAMKNDYGTTDGQLATMNKQTFWKASMSIIFQCYSVLRKGGHAIWNVKDFIRKGKRVCFTDDWLKLCQHCGFRLVCRHRAMLVKKVRSISLRDEEGEVKYREKDVKSFFKRKYDSKLQPGDPRRVDWEDILCMVKE